MSNLKDLLESVSAKDTTWETVGSLSTMVATDHIDKSNYRPQGKYPVISQASEFISGFTDQGNAMPKDEFICFGDHTLCVKFIDFSFIQGADGLKILKVRDKQTIYPKYFYYCVQIAASNLPSGYERHWKLLRQFSLPIPPLEVQKRIADTLDKFTELEAELEERNRQYGFYRAKLMHNGAPEIPLKDLVAITKGKQLNKELCSKVQTEETPFPVVNGGMKPSGFWNECNFDKGKITIAQGGACGFVSWQTLPFWAGAHCFVVSNFDNKKLNYRYLYYFLKEKQVDLQSQKQGATIPSLSADALLLRNIPLPPLETQKEIADILDRFTALTSSMKAGIPAEISLRRKQMDWYRDAMFKALYSGEEK